MGWQYLRILKMLAQVSSILMLGKLNFPELVEKQPDHLSVADLGY